LIIVASATVHFKEEFADASWEKRWTPSTHHEKDGTQGKFTWEHGPHAYPVDDKGIKTSEDARFYGISTGFSKFSNKGKDLVIQYEVKFTQSIDCGGGYLKIGGGGAPGSAFHGETPYNVMFGPDFCGASTKRVHVIFSYKGKNHLIKKPITPKEDKLTHLYTLIVKPDNTYEVLIDGTEAAAGKLTEDFDFLPPKEIKDPSKSKPADWVDEAEMDDASDKKPADWDVPKTIKDPEAKKPEDWDDSLDGEWEAPVIDNPEYKGDWKAKRIPNPAYKGSWVHPVIANPEYKEDSHIYAFDDFSFVGVDVWQVKSGTIFDNILITDDIKQADEYAKKTFHAHQEEEKKLHEKEKEEADKAEAEKAAKAKAEEVDDEGEDKEEKKEKDEL